MNNDDLPGDDDMLEAYKVVAFLMAIGASCGAMLRECKEGEAVYAMLQMLKDHNPNTYDSLVVFSRNIVRLTEDEE